MQMRSIQYFYIDILFSLKVSLLAFSEGIIMNTTDSIKGAPLPSIRRLPQYLQLLRQMQTKGRIAVSCTHLADDLGFTSTQVRKDLAVTGIIGKPKVGYITEELIASIENFLGWNNYSDAFLVGVGNMGNALLGYDDFRLHGLNIVAAFDANPEKIGKNVHNCEIFALDKMYELAERMHIQIGILTVPAAAAQSVASEMVLAGIRAIWNFSPVALEVPDSIIVENVRLYSSLAVLTSRLANTNK